MCQRLFSLLSSRCRRAASRWKVGVPGIRSTFPLTVGFLFPDLDIFAVVVDRLPAGVIHSKFIRATDEAKVARFRHFYFGRFPTNDEAGAGEHILPNLPNCFLCCCRRRVWRQYRGVIGIVGNSLVQVLASRSFRPGGISVTKCLLGLAVPGQTDPCSGQTENKSGYQHFRFHTGIEPGIESRVNVFCFRPRITRIPRMDEQKETEGTKTLNAEHRTPNASAKRPSSISGLVRIRPGDRSWGHGWRGRSCAAGIMP